MRHLTSIFNTYLFPQFKHLQYIDYYKKHPYHYLLQIKFKELAYLMYDRHLSPIPAHYQDQPPPTHRSIRSHDPHPTNRVPPNISGNKRTPPQMANTPSSNSIEIPISRAALATVAWQSNCPFDWSALRVEFGSRVPQHFHSLQLFAGKLLGVVTFKYWDWVKLGWISG